MKRIKGDEKENEQGSTEMDKKMKGHQKKWIRKWKGTQENQQ